MLAPLLDSRGQLRYYLGAQVDVSGLVKDGTDLEAFRRMLEEREGKTQKQNHKDELQELSRMFNNAELDIVRRFGGSMHREIITDDAEGSTHHRPRVLIRDQTNSEFDNSHPSAKLDTRISGVYTHVRSPLTCLIGEVGIGVFRKLKLFIEAELTPIVSLSSASTFITHPVHFSFPSRPGDSTITLP
jgi:hypothetical protein